MSSYASLMVSVDLDSAAINRIRLADTLAERFGARLIGVAAAPIRAPLYGDVDPATYAHLVEDDERRARKALKDAQDLFRETVGPRDGVEWRSAVAVPMEYLASQARVADLVAVGRRGPDDAFDRRLGVPPGSLLMGLGRPVLLVPPRVDRLYADRIVVAWKDTREARRAVLDGLPLLRPAKEILIVAVGEGNGTGEPRDGAADVAAWFKKCHLQGNTGNR